MLLRTVSKTDPPKAVDHDYLVNLGFKREVDEGLLKLLSFLGFIDQQGHPTVLWVNYNDPDADAGILQDAIRKAYGGLFDKYPRAFEKEGTVLMDFFRSNAGASDNNAAYMILTFKVLCDLAEMGEERTGTPVETAGPAPPPPPIKAPQKRDEEKKEPEKVPVTSPAPEPGGPVLRISLNIDIDRDEDPELRDLVMRLLRKQLGS